MQVLKIMIVDDSNIIRNRIMRVIDTLQERKNFPAFQIIGAARNGLEAVHIYKEQKPHIITMDLTMPELDGLDCIKQIMKISKNTKILVVSAISDKSSAIEALKYGASGFLHKPFSDEQLVEAFIELISDEDDE